MSAAFFLLALLLIARFILVVVVTLVALMTRDDVRRETALAILSMMRSTRAGTVAARKGTSDKGSMNP